MTRSRTLLFFREISCGFRVSPRCRDPKDEALRLRSAKVGAPMSRPTKAKLKANCADLQAGPQAQRFSREATRQRGEFLCIGRRPDVRCLHSYQILGRSFILEPQGGRANTPGSPQSLQNEISLKYDCGAAGVRSLPRKSAIIGVYRGKINDLALTHPELSLHPPCKTESKMI